MSEIFKNPFEIQNEDGDFPAVFLVEHARNTIPPELNNLGLSEEFLSKHIAWDIGIEAVSRKISDALSVPAIYSCYSRLIVDANRPLGHPELIYLESDGVAIPGNQNLSIEDKEARINSIYHPYHNAAQQLIQKTREKHDGYIVVINMHSCTAQLLGQPLRPWNISLSTYDSDELIEALAAQLQNEGMHVGLHEPFNIKRDSQQNSLAIHAWKRKLPQIHIEIRQDQIESEEGIAEWAERLARLFPFIKELAESGKTKAKTESMLNALLQSTDVDVA